MTVPRSRTAIGAARAARDHRLRLAPDEADAFTELGPRFGVVPVIVGDAVSDAGVAAAAGNRCVSVGHRSELSMGELRALREAGVEYVSTRSIGVDHIDLAAAAHVGITVGNVSYAPDGVADYTLMLILMAVRGARQTVLLRRASRLPVGRRPRAGISAT